MPANIAFGVGTFVPFSNKKHKMNFDLLSEFFRYQNDGTNLYVHPDFFVQALLSNKGGVEIRPGMIQNIQIQSFPSNINQWKFQNRNNQSLEKKMMAILNTTDIWLYNEEKDYDILITSYGMYFCTTFEIYQLPASCMRRNFDTYKYFDDRLAKMKEDLNTVTGINAADLMDEDATNMIIPLKITLQLSNSYLNNCTTWASEEEQEQPNPEDMTISQIKECLGPNCPTGAEARAMKKQDWIDYFRSFFG